MNHVPFVCGQSQKKGIGPIVKAMKSVKGVSSVDQLPSVQLVINFYTVALDLPVVARLDQFWKNWAVLGVSPKVIRILKEGRTHPFQN